MKLEIAEPGEWLPDTADESSFSIGEYHDDEPVMLLHLDPEYLNEHGLTASEYLRNVADGAEATEGLGDDTDTTDEAGVRPLHIERDPGRERDSASEETVTARGAQLPSETIVIEWRREAFEPDQRSEEVVTSRYQTVNDAEQATGGTVVFDDTAGPA